MPQVVFSPTSQNDTTLNELAFRAMSENLAQNIDYRRKQQTRKAATAQDMEAKMAAGLMPKSAMTVTDEGFEFKDNTAKQAFYDKLGAMFGGDSRDREGRTTQTTQLINRDKQFSQDIASAVEANRGQDADYMDAVTREMAAQTLEFGRERPRPLTDADLRGQYNEQVNQELNKLMGKGSALRGSNIGGTAGLAVKMAEQLAAINAAKSVPAPTTPTEPAAPAKPEVKGSKSTSSVSAKATDAEKIAAAIGSKASEKAMSKYSKEVGGIDVSSDVYAQTTTDKQSARIDELKTSLSNLMGLSAFENYGNQLMRVADPNSISNETFSGMANKRSADLIRWENAATTDGVTQDIKQIGKRQVKTEGSKWSGEVGTAAAYGFSPSININTTSATGGSAKSGDGGQQQAGKMRSLAGKTGVQGQDFEYRRSGTTIWKTQFDANSLDPRFKTGGKIDVAKTANQLLANVRLGGTEPEEREMILEMGAGNDKAYYSVAKNGWFSDAKLTVPASEPMNKTYVKMYQNNTGNQIGAISASDFKLRNFSERMAADLLDTQRSGATTSAGATLNNPTP